MLLIKQKGRHVNSERSLVVGQMRRYQKRYKMSARCGPNARDGRDTRWVRKSGVDKDVVGYVHKQQRVGNGVRET